LGRIHFVDVVAGHERSASSTSIFTSAVGGMRELEDEEAADGEEKLR
jgi:hypothetical protein